MAGPYGGVGHAKAACDRHKLIHDGDCVRCLRELVDRLTATDETMNATAKQIAEQINATGGSYYGEPARGWDRDGKRRVYFGGEFVTIESDGEIHARKGTGRAQTIGGSAVELVEQAVAALTTAQSPAAETSPVRPISVAFLPSQWVVTCDATGLRETVDSYREACKLANPLANAGHGVQIEQVAT